MIRNDFSLLINYKKVDFLAYCGSYRFGLFSIFFYLFLGWNFFFFGEWEVGRLVVFVCFYLVLVFKVLCLGKFYGFGKIGRVGLFRGGECGVVRGW